MTLCVSSVVDVPAVVVVASVDARWPIAAAAFPPLGSGPWWGTGENPCSSWGFLGVGGGEDSLPHLVQS